MKKLEKERKMPVFEPEMLSVQEPSPNPTKSGIGASPWGPMAP